MGPPPAVALDLPRRAAYACGMGKGIADVAAPLSALAGAPSEADDADCSAVNEPDIMAVSALYQRITP